MLTQPRGICYQGCSALRYERWPFWPACQVLEENCWDCLHTLVTLCANKVAMPHFALVCHAMVMSEASLLCCSAPWSSANPLINHHCNVPLQHCRIQFRQTLPTVIPRSSSEPAHYQPWKWGKVVQWIVKQEKLCQWALQTVERGQSNGT